MRLILGLIAGTISVAVLDDTNLPAQSVPSSRTGGTLKATLPFETSFSVQASGKPGPTVVITAGMHGDEPAGAIAAEQICHWPIQCGKLVVMPRCNALGLAAKMHGIPGAASAVADMNSNFPAAGDSNEARGEPAQAIWNWVGSVKPDWLLDLEEGDGIHGAGAASEGSSIVACKDKDAGTMSTVMLDAVNGTITEVRKKFVSLGPPAEGSLARAVCERLKDSDHAAHAMILETSVGDLPIEASVKGDASHVAKKHQPVSLRVRQDRIMIATLLKRLNMLDAAVDPMALPDGLAPAGSKRILLYDAVGTSGDGVSDVELIAGENNMTVCRVGPEEIASGSLTQGDLLVIPGGFSETQAKVIGEKGREKIRDYVKSGGGYVGICAGAYYGSSGFDWSLNLVGAKTVSPKWERGVGTVKLELTPQGNKLLGDHKKPIDILYFNGPILEPKPVEGLPPYEVLAYFRTEFAEHGSPKGVMVNSPAIVASQCGKGRVVLISPHPERYTTTHELFLHAVEWVLNGESKPKS